MSVIEELYNEWLDAPSGFCGGVDFKVWLAVNVAQLRAAAAERDELQRTITAQAAQLEQAQNDGAEWMRKCVMDVLREKSIEFFKEYERKNGDTSASDLIASNCAAAMRDIVSYLPTWLAANGANSSTDTVKCAEPAAQMSVNVCTQMRSR